MGESDHYGYSDERFDALTEVAAQLNEDPKYSRFRWEATPLGLVMQESGDLSHARIISRLVSVLKEVIEPPVEAGFDLEFTVGGGFGRKPDAFVQDMSQASEFENGKMRDCSGVLLFAEVTSKSTRAEDLGLHRESIGVGKPVQYADAGVPIYLVVDRRQGMMHVYSDPEPGKYATVLVVNVGSTVRLPAPLSADIESDWIKELLD